MCLECDGYSHEEAMQAYDLIIRVHGWMLVPIEDDDISWCYTVGLVENFHHPELVMVDVCDEVQFPLISHLVELIMEHGEIPQDALDDLEVTCVEVHEDHLRSNLFGTWANRYGELPRSGDVIQVLLPTDSYCHHHRRYVRRLDQPGPILPVPPVPNRAERRRRRRPNA